MSEAISGFPHFAHSASKTRVNALMVRVKTRVNALMAHAGYVRFVHGLDSYGRILIGGKVA
jgi:hypothetical protein